MKKKKTKMENFVNDHSEPSSSDNETKVTLSDSKL